MLSSTGNSESLLEVSAKKFGCQDNVTFACLFSKMYEARAGFDDRNPDGKMVYGEVLPAGVTTLLDSLAVPVSKNDVFYDLGSGTGKIPLQVFLSTNARHVWGLELSSIRHGHAVSALKSLHDAIPDSDFSGEDSKQATLTIDGERSLSFGEADVLKADLRDATVLVVSSLAFPIEVTYDLGKRMAGLVPGTLGIFGRRQLGCHRGLTYLGQVRTQCSWAEDSPMYMYIVSPMLDGSMGTGMPPGSLVPQQARLEKAIAEKGDVINQHRQFGDRGTLVACDAADLEAVSQMDDNKVISSLLSMDLSAKDKEGADLLHHLVKRHQTALDAASRFTPSQASADQFKQYQLKKGAHFVKLIKLVLEHRVDPNNIDDKGLRPLDDSIESGDSNLVDLLKKHGAKLSPSKAKQEL